MKIDIRVHSAPKHGRNTFGWKSEDAFAHTSLLELPFVAAIADGHGDEYVNEETTKLAQFVAHQLCWRRSSSLQNLCSEIQQDVLSRFGKSFAGAAATRFEISNQGIRVMWLGDCRLYRFAPELANACEQITQDHHPDDPKELKRLEPFLHPAKPNSEFILFPVGGTPKYLARVYTSFPKKTYVRGCAVTRSFGDGDLFPPLISEPDVLCFPVDQKTRTIFALCSDGGQEVVERVFREAGSRLCVSLDTLHNFVCLYAGPEPSDDMTILLIEFHPETV